jgi:4-oxalocrotonate tautomerase
MPFVHIQIVKGHSRKRKGEMARRIADAVSDVTRLPKDAVWIVFEDVPAEEWFVGDRSVRRIRARAK